MRAVAQSKVSGWLVSGNVPQSVVDAEIRRSFWSLAIGGLILLALAVTLAAFFARWIIAPMQALAASVVSQKGFNNPLLLASPVIEVNDVASALRAATVELTATAASLRESEQRLVLAQRTAGMTHLVADLKSNIVVASETFEEIFGFRLPNGDVSKVFRNSPNACIQTIAYARLPPRSRQLKSSAHMHMNFELFAQVGNCAGSPLMAKRLAIRRKPGAVDRNKSGHHASQGAGGTYPLPIARSVAPIQEPACDHPGHSDADREDQSFH